MHGLYDVSKICNEWPSVVRIWCFAGIDKEGETSAHVLLMRVGMRMDDAPPSRSTKDKKRWNPEIEAEPQNKVRRRHFSHFTLSLS